MKNRLVGALCATFLGTFACSDAANDVTQNIENGLGESYEATVALSCTEYRNKWTGYVADTPNACRADIYGNSWSKGAASATVKVRLSSQPSLLPGPGSDYYARATATLKGKWLSLSDSGSARLTSNTLINAGTARDGTQSGGTWVDKGTFTGTMALGKSGCNPLDLGCSGWWIDEPQWGVGFELKKDNTLSVRLKARAYEFKRYGQSCSASETWVECTGTGTTLAAASSDAGSPSKDGGADSSSTDSSNLDAMAPLDGTSVDADGATTDGGVPEAGPNDAACRAEYASVKALESAINATLGVTSTCTVAEPKKQPYGNDYYYTGKVSCSLAPEPSSGAAATFTTEMQKRGYYGFSLVTTNGVSNVTGSTSSRLCGS